MVRIWDKQVGVNDDDGVMYDDDHDDKGAAKFGKRYALALGILMEFQKEFLRSCYWIPRESMLNSYEIH